MSRIGRVVLPGVPHHVTQRGNGGQSVFFTTADRVEYLNLIRDTCRQHGVEIWAYCLMDNHVHLLVVPRKVGSLALGVGRAHRAHAVRVNLRRKLQGHLWSQRYYSTPLDEHHLWAAARYIERNPIRAGLVQRAEDYPWSSAPCHVLGSDDPVLAPGRPFPGSIDWRAFLTDERPDPRVAELRRSTRSGRPCGDATFIRSAEEAAGRILVRVTPGRPRRATASPQAERLFPEESSREIR